MSSQGPYTPVAPPQRPDLKTSQVRRWLMLGVVASALSAACFAGVTAALHLVDTRTCEDTPHGQRCIHTRYRFFGVTRAAVVTTLDGVLDGPATFWSSRGFKTEEGMFANGERAGCWSFWDAQGGGHRTHRFDGLGGLSLECDDPVKREPHTQVPAPYNTTPHVRVVVGGLLDSDVLPVLQGATFSQCIPAHGNYTVELHIGPNGAVQDQRLYEAEARVIPCRGAQQCASNMLNLAFPPAEEQTFVRFVVSHQPDPACGGVVDLGPAPSPGVCDPVKPWDQRMAEEAGLTQEVVERLQAKHAASIRRCHKESVRMGESFNGRVRATLLLGEKGTVERVDLKGDMQDTVLGNCLASAIQKWIFPRPEGEPFELDITVTLPRR